MTKRELRELIGRVRSNKYLMRSETDYIINSLEELQQYRAIGTPEECQEAMGKQTAKKIKQQQWMYTICSCGHEFSKHHGDGYYSIPQEQKTKYCPDCGQRLDWSDEDGN